MAETENRSHIVESEALWGYNLLAGKLKALKDSITSHAPNQQNPGVILGDWLNFWCQSYKKPNLRPNT